MVSLQYTLPELCRVLVLCELYVELFVTVSVQYGFHNSLSLLLTSLMVHSDIKYFNNTYLIRSLG